MKVEKNVIIESTKIKFYGQLIGIFYVIRDDRRYPRRQFLFHISAIAAILMYHLSKPKVFIWPVIPAALSSLLSRV